MIALKQIDGGEVTPKDDGLLYDFLIDQNGIFEGCTVTHLGANQLKVATGRGIIKGRNFSITEETVLATLATSESKKGRLLIKVDLSNTEAPIQFVTQCADALPSLTQEDINRGGNVFELPLSTYDVGTTAITNLVSVAPQVIAVTVTASEKADWDSKADGAHTHTKSQIDDFAHTHAPTDLTEPVPLHKGGTNGSDVFQGSYNLRRETAVGVPSSVSVTGWFLVGEQSLDTAFITAGTVIAVNGGNELGSGILKLHTRVDGTAGVLNTSISKLTWMCTDGKINPEHFAIDASSGTLKLYVYITGGYRLYMFSILDEYLTGDVTNRSKAFNMTRNYSSSPVAGVNYLTSITKTLVSTKEPTNYVQSTSPSNAVVGDLWAW